MRKILVLIVLFLFGCASQGFKLEYGYGSCNKDWGWTQISLDQNGEMVVNIDGTQEHYKAGLNDIRRIRNLISEIAELDEEYINPHVTGGMCSETNLTINGISKHVVVANEPVQPITIMANELIDILNKLNPEWHS